MRSLFRYKKQLKPNITKLGYQSVELFKNGKSKRLSIHRLVAGAFIVNPDNLPQVNHRDETPSNNCAENLEWCTAKYNMNYGTGAKTRHLKIDYSKPCYAENARINGKIVSRPVVQLSKTGEFLQRFESGKEAHKATHINHSHILECCNGKTYKTVGGYVWKYEERWNDLLASLS